jgi:VanZ family protein
VLAALLWLALVGTFEPLKGRWSWRPVLWTLGLIVVYAASDEFHQSLVPNRQGTVADVVIDTVGACIGLALVWAVGKWRGKW